MKTNLTAIALLLVLILSLHAAPLAFDEILLLVRTHESDSFISQQLSQRRLLRALTPQQETTLKAQGASDVLFKTLRNPNIQLSQSEAVAFEAQRQHQTTALQERIQQEALAAKTAATRAAAQAAATPAIVAKDATWLTNYDKALELAKAENKSVLLDFTGSDWCGWCEKMVKEALSQKEFLDYAAKNLILVEVDFPHNKKQSEEVKTQNAELQKKFGARGYPTFVLVDKYGQQLGKQAGYLEGGASAFIAKLDGFKAGKK
jgi:protein disulfide-isomerase